MEWLNKVFGHTPYTQGSLEGALRRAFYQHRARVYGTKGIRIVYDWTYCENRTLTVPIEEFVHKLCDLVGGSPFTVEVDESEPSHHIVSEGAYIVFSPDSDGGCSDVIQCLLTDPKMPEKITVLYEECSREPDPESGGEVYALTKSSYGGITISEIGRVDEPLVETNYEEDVVTTFHDIVERIQEGKDRKGRIVILDGVPGTGKSFFIRAMISHVGEEARFVLVPPDMVQELGKPVFLSTLVEHSQKDSPMVLVIEDADAVLSERNRDSVAALSAALNLGDGIIGDALNVWMVLSTNAPVQEIDDAMMRKGRLLARLELRGLPLEAAARAASEMSGTEVTVDAVREAVVSQEKDSADQTLRRSQLVQSGAAVPLADIYALFGREEEGEDA